MPELFKQIDYELFLLINGASNSLLDNVMVWISSMALWTPLYVLLVYLVFRKYKTRGFIAIGFLLLAVALSDLASVHLFKNVFLRLRPCYEPELAGMVKNIVGCGGQYGFVSSHASNSFAIVGMVILLVGNKNKQLQWIMPLWGISIMYSRIYLGKHYPSDVFFGALLGLLVAYLVFLLFKYTVGYLSKSLTNT
jgi:undecaprenyl-diphosphatase